MGKLNQLIAVVNGKKAHFASEVAKMQNLLGKAELLNGLSRVYTPKDDNGERFPSEEKIVQHTVAESIDGLQVNMEVLLDALASQDVTNCFAKGDIVVDGTILVKDVPATHLMVLDKYLETLLTFVRCLPTLDQAERWTVDANSGHYMTAPVGTAKTKKVPKTIVKYEATPEHPAQVDVFTEDVLVGTWQTVKFSGALPMTVKNRYVTKIRQLKEAVAVAREAANNVEIVDFSIGEVLLSHIFD